MDQHKVPANALNQNSQSGRGTNCQLIMIFRNGVAV